VTLSLGRGCAAHRAALLDFVDARDRSAVPRAALAHLERCPRCEAEMTDLALTVTALRRLAGDVAGVEPPTTAWPALLARIDEPAVVDARRPSMLTSLIFRAGMAGAVAISVVAVAFGGPLSPRPASPLADGHNNSPLDPAMTVEVTVDRGAPLIDIAPDRPPVAEITPAAWAGPDGLGVPRAQPKAVTPRPNPTSGAI
jgi:hypothetical protein